MALDKVLAGLAALDKTGDPKALYAACTGLQWDTAPIPFGSDDDRGPDDFDVILAAWTAGKVPDDVYAKCRTLAQKSYPNTGKSATKT